MSFDYGRSAERWRSELEHIYRRFGRALVRAVPVGLTGRRVLDLGAGTGALSGELWASGAVPIATDISPLMLVQARGVARGLRVVGADALHLPFARHEFDVSLSAFLINHLPEPWLQLAEAARVTRRGGVLMTMTFAAGDDHPAKEAVDEVAGRLGWQAPAWFDEQKRWATLTDTPGGLAHQAGKAGVPVSEIQTVAVDAGPLTPRELVGWRLGHAHMAEFLARLPVGDRRRLVVEAERAVGPGRQPLRRELLILSSHLSA